MQLLATSSAEFFILKKNFLADFDSALFCYFFLIQQKKTILFSSLAEKFCLTFLIAVNLTSFPSVFRSRKALYFKLNSHIFPLGKGPTD